MVEIPNVPFTNCVTDGRLLTLFDFSVLISKMRILIVTLPSAEDEMRWREVSVCLSHSGGPYTSIFLFFSGGGGDYDKRGL